MSGTEEKYSALLSAVQRQAQELALLDRVRTALARELDLSAVFRTVVEAIAQTFGYTQVSLYLLQNNILKFQHQVGYAHVIYEIPLSAGIMGKTVRAGQPALVEDVRAEPAFLGAIEGVMSEICIPLFDEGKVVGALNVESTNNVRLSAADLQLMIALSEHVNIAIGRARLYGEAWRRSRILSALYDTTLALMNRLELADLLEAIVLRAAELCGTEHGFIYLADPGGGEMELKVGIGVYTRYIGFRLKRGEGLSGRVWQTGEPLVIENYNRWPDRAPQFSLDEVDTVIGVPLTSGSSVVGVIGIARENLDPSSGGDEVELLSRFAQLASIALDNAKLYTSAQNELAERKRAEDALAAANIELEQALLNANELALAAQAASRAKSEFLANMSHEIRTPLSAVLGFTELAHGTQLTGEQRQYVGRIQQSAELLLELLNGVLDFAKIESAQIELESIPFDPVKLIDEVTSLFAARAAAKNVALKTSVSAAVPATLLGDPTRLRQILINLLNNAVKFTEKGDIVVSVGVEAYGGMGDTPTPTPPHSHTLYFSVQDTGIGISREKLSAIFEPFTQADGSITRKYGGTGLGLAIAQRLVEKMGGRLRVSSEPGRGSTFDFYAAFGLRGDLPVPARAATAPARGGESRWHILVAEDNSINREVTAKILEIRGWRTTVVEDGLAAVANASENAFDLILMDVQMPAMDGLSAIAAIRENERGNGGHAPIVAVTAHAMPGDRERCLAAGADEYLAKPFKASQLYEIVERLARVEG